MKFIKLSSSLLREYISAIVEESLLKGELDEDINPERLSARRVGIYAFAQAMNRLIYEGEALPGAVPIEIIDSRLNGEYDDVLMTTSAERAAGISFQYSGSSFKLYMNPYRGDELVINSGDETHDIMHAFTAHIAKAFGRRREAVVKAGNYKITPSRFNKITLDWKMIRRIREEFKKEYGLTITDDMFKKVFDFKGNIEGYANWLSLQLRPDIASVSSFEKNPDRFLPYVTLERAVRNMAAMIYEETIGSGADFTPGQIGRQYFSRKEQPAGDPELRTLTNPGFRSDHNFGLGHTNVKYKQSAEDEEEFGNRMNDVIGDYVGRSIPIPAPKISVEKIFDRYNSSVGLTDMTTSEFRHRFNTPEVKKSLTRLFEIYNSFLQRYMAGKK